MQFPHSLVAYVTSEQKGFDEVRRYLARLTHMEFPHTLHFVANLFQIAMRAVHEYVVENVVEGGEYFRGVRGKILKRRKVGSSVGDEENGDGVDDVTGQIGLNGGCAERFKRQALFESGF